MKSNTALSLRVVAGLAVAASALLSAGSASAQTPFYAFTVNNLTGVGGDPTFSVADSVNFNNLQINEVFADSTTQSFTLPGSSPFDPALEQGDSSASPILKSLPGSSYVDPTHGALTSATLTGTLSFPGLLPDGSGKLNLTIQPTADPASQYSQFVFTSFSTDLFGPDPAVGPAVGTFSLLNLGGTQGNTTVNIYAPVPEASTTVSLGLLLALGLGTVAVARRRKAAQTL